MKNVNKYQNLMPPYLALDFSLNQAQYLEILAAPSCRFAQGDKFRKPWSFTCSNFYLLFCRSLSKRYQHALQSTSRLKHIC